MESTSLTNEMGLFLATKNNDELRSRENRIQALIKTPSGLSELLQTLKNPASPGLQKLACILLKKSVVKTFNQFNESNRANLKKEVLQVMTLNPQVLPPNNAAIVAESVACVAKISGMKGLNSWPELQVFISKALEANGSELTYNGVSILLAIAELRHEMIESAEKIQIFQRLGQIIGSNYNPGLNLAYIDSVRLMGTLILALFEDDMTVDMKGLLQQVLVAAQSVQGFPGLMGRYRCTFEQKMSSIIEDLISEIDLNPEPFKPAKELLLEFIVSENLLAGANVGLGLKSTACHLLCVLLEHFHNCFTPKEGNPDIFPGLFQLLHRLLLEDETARRGQLATQELSPEDYIREESQSNVVLQLFKVLSLEYPHAKVYELFKQFFASLSGTPAIQLNLLLATSEGFYSFFSRDFELYFKFLLEKIMVTAPEGYIEALLAMRVLSCFTEFLTIKTLDKFDLAIRAVAGHLVFQGPVDEARELLLEEVFIALELLVENCEEEHVQTVGFELLTRVVSFVQGGTASLTIRKNVLRVISALVSSLPQSKIQEIHKDLIAVLASCCLEDLLVAETLVSLGRLSLYHLRDDPNRVRLYESLYGQFAKRVATICMRPQDIDDYDLLEGAFNFVYMGMMVLGRDIKVFFPPQMVIILIQYITGIMNGDLIKPPVSEGETENDEIDLAAVMMGIPFKSMVVGLFKVVGHGFETYADEIMSLTQNKQMETLESVNTLLSCYQLDENEDVRCQTFESSCQLSIGLLKHCQLDKQSVMLTQLVDIASMEKLNLVINRIVSMTKNWFSATRSLISEQKTAPESLFNRDIFDRIGLTINNILAKQYDIEQIDPDLLGSLCVLVEAMLTKIVDPKYKQRLVSKYGEAKVHPELSSKRVEFSPQIKQLLFSFLDLIFQNMFKPLVQPGAIEIDASVHEELVGHIAEVINQVGPDALLFFRSKFGDQFLLNLLTSGPNSNDEAMVRNSVFLLAMFFEHSADRQFLGQYIPSLITLLSQIFQKFPSNAAIKDNCLAATARALVSPVFAPLASPLISPGDLYSQLENSLPLNGDAQESNIIWKFMLATAQENLAGFEARLLQQPKMLTFVLKTLVDGSIKLDDQIYDWLVGFVKRQTASIQLQGMLKALDPASAQKLSQVLA